MYSEMSRSTFLGGGAWLLDSSRQGLFVERDYLLRHDLFIVGQGGGGSITRAHRGLRLGGALRGRKPMEWIQGGGRGGGQMSRWQATVSHLERVWEGVLIHLY